MNGPDKKTDNYLRGEEVFDVTVKNLKTFRNVKDERDKNVPEIHITPILTSENYGKLIDFVELCNKLDADFLRIQPFMSDMLPNKQPGPDSSRRRFSEDLEIKDHQIEDLIEEVELAQDAISDTGIGHNLEGIKSKYSEQDENKEVNEEEIKDEDEINDEDYNLASIPCYFPWHVLHIDAQGNATPCPQEPVKMNIKDHSLGQVWESDKFENLRERIACNFLSGKCRYCCPVLDNDNQEIRSYMEEVFEGGELEVSPKLVESFREKHRVYNKLEDLEDFKRRIEDKLEDLEMNEKNEGEDEF